MLEVKNLEVSYGNKKVLKNLNFELAGKDMVAVIGESGTGKTTLALSLMGLLPWQSDNVKISGQVLFRGKDICKIKESGLRIIRWKKISIVFQNVDSILNPTLTIYRQISELVNKGRKKSLVQEILKTVDFPVSRINAYPHQLSMGEKQKVMVAMAYILDPDLVILDEPTSSLDLENKDRIIKTIKGLSKNRAVLLVTHDLDTAEKLSEKTMVLYGGSIVELGPTKKIFSEPRHPYTRGLMRSYPGMKRTKDLQGIRGQAEFIDLGCPFWPRCTQSIEICRNKRPRLKEYGEIKLACHRGGIVPLLRVEDISKSYGRKEVLKSINLELYEGETAALLGKSGSGKTTLAKIIMGLLSPGTGKVYLENELIEKWDASFYRKAQMIFQDVRSSVSHRLNILNIVMEPMVIQGMGSPAERIESVKKVLTEAELPTNIGFLNSYPHHLSGGELQRVIIARALILSPKLLIADEPTSFLDPSIQAKILKLLNNIQEERGLGMLFITHDIGVARKVSDRVMRLENGILRKERLK
jgi:peptide/nickel transport system ATP-binding protein